MAICCKYLLLFCEFNNKHKQINIVHLYIPMHGPTGRWSLKKIEHSNAKEKEQTMTKIYLVSKINLGMF